MSYSRSSNHSHIHNDAFKFLSLVEYTLYPGPQFPAIYPSIYSYLFRFMCNYRNFESGKHH